MKPKCGHPFCLYRWHQFKQQGLIKRVDYSQKACEKTCGVDLVYELCHCVDSTVITHEIAKRHMSKPDKSYWSKILNKTIPMPHTCYMVRDGHCIAKVLYVCLKFEYACMFIEVAYLLF